MVKRASLQSIDLFEQSAIRREAPATGPVAALPDLSLTIGQEIRLPKHPESQSACLLTFTIGWIEQETPDAVHAQARFQYRLLYGFEGEPPSAEDFELLAGSLGIHHAWPFLRERIRTFAADLGLPPTLLPLRQLPQILTTGSKPESQGRASA